MARGTVNIQPLAANAGTSYAGTAIDGTNGLVVPAGGLTRNLVFRITSTSGTAGSVLVGPGSYPPAFRRLDGTAAPGGTLVVPIAGSAEAWFAVESARVVQADGSINLDFNPTTWAGQVFAFRLPYDI